MTECLAREILDNREGRLTMIRADDSVGLQTRRCFLSVMAAEKAAQRATECGESAKIYLA
jgi:hypothetical protein